jgi:hypothetical protein
MPPGPAGICVGPSPPLLRQPGAGPGATACETDLRPGASQGAQGQTQQEDGDRHRGCT